MKTTALFIALMLFTTLVDAQEKYYFSKTFELSFEEASTQIKASLKEQGFGIVAESNMDKMLKEKVGAELLPYRVLGACNPKIAHKALLAEENIGIFLPCKVIIKYITDTKTEIVMVNPSVAMKPVKNKKAQELFKEVSVLMKKALEGVK